MRALRSFASAFALLALAGCATSPPPAQPLPHAQQQPADVVEAKQAEPLPAVPVIVVPPVDETALALGYFDRVRRLPAAELARELESMRSTYLRTHADLDRLQLAMLLALPNTAVTDDARALELLDPIAKSPLHVLHPVAVLLSTYVQEQRRLAQSSQALQKDVQTLQQKLDALRTLERTLSEREGVVPRRR